MKFLVGAATAASATILIVSLVAIGVIFNDITMLYDDVMDEMGSFKVS